MASFAYTEKWGMGMAPVLCHMMMHYCRENAFLFYIINKQILELLNFGFGV